MKRRMLPASVLTEAWRDFLTGTSRALLWAGVFLATVGLVAVFDVRSVVTVIQGAASFQQTGGATQVLAAQGQIDGQRCQALSGVGGIASAGAVRQGTPVVALNMPSTPIGVVEATQGVIDMLPVIALPYEANSSVSGGVWLSADLAQMLGAAPGNVIHTADGTATVAGVYTWPDDGRSRDLGYAMVVPVPPEGVFDQCWAQVWPPDVDLANLLFDAANGDVTPGNGVKMGQLNVSQGATYDAARLLASRPTRQAGWAGGTIGLVLGYAAVRARRLEVASSLHAGVPKPHLAWQHLLETAIWTLGVSMITAAGLLWAARLGNPDPSWTTWTAGLRTIAAGAAGTLIGAVLGVVTTREKDLFRYTKDR